MAGQKDKSQWVRCVVGVSVLGGARVVPKNLTITFFFFYLLGRYTKGNNEIKEEWYHSRSSVMAW